MLAAYLGTIATLNVLVLSWIMTHPSSAKEIEVIDTHVDIVFIYDRNGNYVDHTDKIWKEVVMKMWLDQYLKLPGGEDDTRFAFLGCGWGYVWFDEDNWKPPEWIDYMRPSGWVEQEPFLRLDGRLADSKENVLNGVEYKNWKDKLNKAYELKVGNEKDFYYSNIKGCTHSVKSNIYNIYRQSNNGDRKDAPNIVFWMSTCVWVGQDATNEAWVKPLLDEHSKNGLFLCAWDLEHMNSQIKIFYKRYFLGDFHGEIHSSEAWKNALHTVRGDRDKLYFCDMNRKDECVKKMNSILPKKKVNVTNCETSGYDETKCKLSIENVCEKTKYPKIILYPDTTPYSTKCPDNKTIKCDENECSCKKNPWVKSGKCCGGKESFWRDVSHRPECISTQEVDNPKCPTPCSGADISPRPRPSSKPPTTTRRKIPPRDSVITQTNSTKKPDDTQHPEHPEVTPEPTKFQTEKDTVRKRPTIPGGKKKQPDDSTLNIVIGAVCAVALLIIVILAIICAVLQQRRRKTKKEIMIIRERKTRHHHRKKGSTPHTERSKSKPHAHSKSRENIHHHRKDHVSGTVDAKGGVKGREHRKGLDVKQKEKDKAIKASVHGEKGKHHTGKHDKPIHK